LEQNIVQHFPMREIFMGRQRFVVILNGDQTAIKRRESTNCDVIAMIERAPEVIPFPSRVIVARLIGEAENFS